MLVFEVQNDFQQGAFLVINKPLSWTSFDVVNKLKYSILHKYKGKFKKIKIGHAGTLDPLATGVVIVCVGKYTKRIESFQELEKEYIAELKLGATTPCYDMEQEEDATYPFEHITQELIEEKLQNFIGEIAQLPPVFSAIKINGRRAYNLAREGKDVSIKARKVKITEIEILHFEGRFLRLRVVCGKGTYIRSLARDLGKALDSGAYLTGLIRSRIGDYTLNNAYNIEQAIGKVKNID